VFEGRKGPPGWRGNCIGNLVYEKETAEGRRPSAVSLVRW
jgi:hypothetical protein